MLFVFHYGLIDKHMIDSSCGILCSELWKHKKISIAVLFSNPIGIVTQLLSFFFCLCIFQPSVDIKTVLSQLMERLSNYAASSAEVLPEFLQVEAFSKLSNAIGKVFSLV
jgi:hypothetical protein